MLNFTTSWRASMSNEEAPKHSLLSASGSATWLYCSGSVAAQKPYKESRSAFADEGTAAHELAEICLKGDLNPFDFEGKQLPETNWITVDKLMCRHVNDYMDFIDEFKGHKIYEQKLDYSEYAQDGFGTADCIVLNGDSVTIIDLKYGKGIKVYADTTQTKIYALGVYSEFGMLEDIKTITMIIYQPRLDHIDELTISIEELLAFGEWVKKRAQLAMQDNAPLTAGDKQCQWCKHKARCPELMRYTENAIQNEFGFFDELPSVNRLSDEQLNLALSSTTLIKSWLSAIEEHVRERLESGDGFTGYKLVEGRSSRDWNNEEEAVIALSDAHTEEELFERSFISVAKFEKLVGKKNIKQFENLIVKKSGKPTVVTESDPRKSLSVSANDFSDFDD
jgi:hypothetical protein